jgi:hypothetical protein
MCNGPCIACRHSFLEIKCLAAAEDDWFVPASTSMLLRRLTRNILHEIEIETIKEYLNQGE